MSERDQEKAKDEAFEAFCQQKHLECSFWKTDRMDCPSRNICKERFLEGCGRTLRASCQTRY